MIEHTQVDGKMATVTYMLKDWTPCDAKDAAMVKVLFDDGGILFGAAQPVKHVQGNVAVSALHCATAKLQCILAEMEI